MISPKELCKHVGVAGRVVAWLKCVAIYFVVSDGTPSASAVVFKCAPVLALMLLVTHHHGSTYTHEGAYARRVALGLAFSALGDALLVWPQHFVAGMAAFAAAHVCYLTAFATKQSQAKTLVAMVLYASVAAYMQVVNPPSALRYLVPVYGVLLASMAWRAVAYGGRAAPAGAMLFLVSDAILGYSLFGGPVPYNQILVMSTYYAGQLGLALSALETSPARAQPTTPLH